MEVITFKGKKSGLLITIDRYGIDDYSAWFRDETEKDDETAGFSVRGTLAQIISEVREEI